MNLSEFLGEVDTHFKSFKYIIPKKCFNVSVHPYLQLKSNQRFEKSLSFLEARKLAPYILVIFTPLINFYWNQLPPLALPLPYHSKNSTLSHTSSRSFLPLPVWKFGELTTCWFSCSTPKIETLSVNKSDSVKAAQVLSKRREPYLWSPLIFAYPHCRVSIVNAWASWRAPGIMRVKNFRKKKT